MLNAGISWKLGKGTVARAMSRKDMINTIDKLTKENESMKEFMKQQNERAAQQDARIAQLEKLIERLAVK